MVARVGEWREVPGPKTRAWFERARRLMYRTTVESQIVVERYRGPYVYDPDENEYLDFSSGVGVASFGGGDALKHIWDTLADLKRTCGACGDIGTDWYNTTMIEAAEYILPRIPSLASQDRKIYLTEGGALANEAALKLVWARLADRGQPERKTVVCFERAFHGRSGYTIKLLDPRKEVRIRGYPMPDFPVIRAPFPDAFLPDPSAILKEFFARISPEERAKVACVIFEPIQGEGGICVPDARALQWWVEAWRNEGAFIIADEVQAGLGRTGRLMSYEHFDIQPDIVTLAKHFGSGVPVAAMIGPASLDPEEHGRVSESFQGSPIAAAAAYATLRHVIEHDIVEQNHRKGAFLQKLLDQKLGRFSCVREVRGLGLMQGVELNDIALRDRVVSGAEHLGLRIIGAGMNENPTIRLLVSYAASMQEIGLGVEILVKALRRALGR